MWKFGTRPSCDQCECVRSRTTVNGLGSGSSLWRRFRLTRTTKNALIAGYPCLLQSRMDLQLLNLVHESCLRPRPKPGTDWPNWPRPIGSSPARQATKSCAADQYAADATWGAIDSGDHVLIRI